MANYFKHPSALVETKQIGDGTRIWAFSHIMKGAVIGKNCNICDHCFIESGAVVGNNVTIKNGVSIWDKVTIEDNVFIGPNVVFTNDLLPRSGKKWTPLETMIREGATVGANTTILCGIEIGKYSLIGAASLIAQTAPPYVLLYGNPARIRGYVCQCANKITFKNNIAKCKDCSKKYVIKNGSIKFIDK